MTRRITIKQKGKKPSNIPNYGKHKDFYQTILMVKLTEDLDEADDEGSQIQPAEAEAEVYRGFDADYGVHTIDGQNEKIKVKNYNPDFSAAEDDFMLVVRLNGVWQPLGGGGGGFALGILKKGSEISARSGKTPGTGQVTLEKFSDGEIEETDKTVEVYSNFTQAIPKKNDDDEEEEEEEKDYYVQLIKLGGKWWINAVDCVEKDEDEE